MFDDFIKDDKQVTSVDALLKLIEHDKVDRITDLEMPQIKVLVIGKWFYYLKIYPEKSAMEILNMVFEYYKEIKASYKRKGREEIVKGISEMKEMLMEKGLVQDAK